MQSLPSPDNNALIKDILPDRRIENPRLIVSTKRELLDLSERFTKGRNPKDDVCRTFEDVLISGKLHQYLRILHKAGIIDFDYPDDDELIRRFLEDAQVQKAAEEAWETQPVIVTVASRGSYPGGMIHHMREMMQNYLSRQNPLFTDIVTMGRRFRWPSSITDALGNAGYVQAQDLQGSTETDLLQISGIGKVSAKKIVADFAIFIASIPRTKESVKITDQ